MQKNHTLKASKENNDTELHLYKHRNESSLDIAL